MPAVIEVSGLKVVELVPANKPAFTARIMLASAQCPEISVKEAAALEPVFVFVFVLVLVFVLEPGVMFIFVPPKTANSPTWVVMTS